jgi:hypothetical protein
MDGRVGPSRHMCPPDPDRTPNMGNLVGGLCKMPLMFTRCVALRRRLAGWSLIMACVLGAGTYAPVANAAEDAKELSRARAKFQRATELEQAGNWAGALQLFREVGQVKMTAQVRYHIALCEMNLGKLVAALGGYELALAEADEVGPAFKKEVSDSIEDLKARIPKLVIMRGEGAQAASIELDGVALGSNYIGVEFPVDPGPHTVEAKAPGHKPFYTTVSIEEKGRETVEVLLERVRVDSDASGGGRESMNAGAGDVARDRPPSRLVPYVIGGVGVASLLASGTFFLLRQGAFVEVEDLCGTPDQLSSCPAENKQKAEEHFNRGVTYNTLSMATLGVGVVAVGVAVTLYVTQSNSSSARLAPRHVAGWQLQPSSPGSDAGMSLVGRF